MQDAPTTVIRAEDEARLYVQATTTHAWAPCGQPPVVRADPGRAKPCFYGTLNLQTGGEVVTHSAPMNAQTTALHLEQILHTHPDVPRLLLGDRAPWHRGHAIRDVLAAHPRLQLLSFPVASPALNPQEHVWKATRRAVSHTHTVATFPILAQQFEAHVHHTTFVTSFLEHRGFYTICPRLNC